MAQSYDAIVIGAGVNGLTTAAYLAKAKRKVLVLESRAEVGGAAASEVFAPGFRADIASSDPGWLSPKIQAELDLQKHGLELLPRDGALLALFPDASPLTITREVQSTAELLRSVSARDAEQWPKFAQRISKLAGFLGALYNAPPPRPIGGGVKELLELAMIGKLARGLGKSDLVELLRVLPMSIAELLDDTFESEQLKAALAPGGVSGLCQGPRSGGTSFLFLHRQVGAELGAFRLQRRVRGGNAALAQALAAAAQAAGAEIRTEAAVARIRVADGYATGVVLADGEEIAAARVLSSADARNTLLRLAGPEQLDPELVRALQNIRFRGVAARVHLALSALPVFNGVVRESETLRGIISIAPSVDYIEKAYDQAKRGQLSTNPVLEVSIPSIADPRLAPRAQHVMSITVQYAPYKLQEGAWDAAQREALGDRVVALVAEYAPDLTDKILHRQVLTPLDLEERYGLTEGSLDQGELGLDQILFMRPIGSMSRYRTPIDGLYLCGASAHPGRTVTGGAGRLAAKAVLSERR